MEAVPAHNCGRLAIGPDDLDLTHTLTAGQSFRWKEDESGVWTGVLGRKVVRLRREGSEILFETLPGPPDESLVTDYLRLDVDLQALYADFSAADEHIRSAIERFKGLRVVRQDPDEMLLSYICTAANSVPRIVGSIEELSRLYGEPIAEVDGRMYYSFPTAQALADAGPDELSSLCGLGFRGANLNSVAKQMLQRPPGWAASLRMKSYEQAREELLGIRGVGCKIADCVLLFSMDKDQAFPVDTHIRKVAVKHYLPEFKQKTLTPAVYQAIVDFFQCKFGPYAGWAQEYLFYDDLLRHGPKYQVL